MPIVFSKCLGEVLTKRHFVDVETLNGLMNRLTEMPLIQIYAAVNRAQMTIIVQQTLINVVNNLKKRKPKSS